MTILYPFFQFHRPFQVGEVQHPFKKVKFISIENQVEMEASTSGENYFQLLDSTFDR